MANQFLRRVDLLLANSAQALRVSDLRVTFKTSSAEVESPNTAVITVFNLNEAHMKQAVKEYDQVVLQAGYTNGNFGIIFRGTVNQYKIGRQDNLNWYLTILASDSDIDYNFGTVNTTLDRGSTQVQEYDELVKRLGAPQDPNSHKPELSTLINPRGKVRFGMLRAAFRTLAANNGAKFSFQNGQVVFVPITGYLPTQAVKLNSATGLIGTPEVTDNGIRLTCMLNTLIQPGCRLQINQRDITQTIIKQQFFPNYGSVTRVANTTFDGFYRAIVVEHSGDTRGEDWTTEIMCLALDPSSPSGDSVLAFG